MNRYIRYLIFSFVCLLYAFICSTGWSAISGATDTVVLWTLDYADEAANGTVTNTTTVEHWGITRDEFRRWKPVGYEPDLNGKALYHFKIPAATPGWAHVSNAVLGASTVFSVSGLFTQPIPIDGFKHFTIQIVNDDGSTIGESPEWTPYVSVWPWDEGFYTEYSKESAGNWNVEGASGFYYSIPASTAGAATAATYTGFAARTFEVAGASLLSVSMNLQSKALQASTPVYNQSATFHIFIGLSKY